MNEAGAHNKGKATVVVTVMVTVDGDDGTEYINPI